MMPPTDSEKPKGGMAVMLALGPKKGAPEPDADQMGGPSDNDEDNYQIQMPKGFQIPDGKEPGQKFDSVVKMHVMPNGMLCIDEIEGVPTYGDKEEAEEPQEKEEEESPQVQDTEEVGGMDSNEQPSAPANFKAGLKEALMRKKSMK